MVKIRMPEYKISVNQLRPGVFIRLDKTNWFDHPFLFNKFKIKDEEQISLLRSLGIKDVFCIPEKSDILPLRPADQRKPEPEKTTKEKALNQEVIDHLWEVKKARTRRLKEKKERIAQCEKRFNSCVKAFDCLFQNMLGGRFSNIDQALGFVERLSEYFLEDRESTLHLMNVMDSSETTYSHPMNVAVLSMMVGKEAGLQPKEMTTLGLAALFHDVGKARIPKKLLKKRGKLTKPEQDLLSQHSAFSAAMLSGIEGFPKEAIRAIAQHHERLDGSGSPERLSGDEIDKLARIIAIANTYDNHCNNSDPEQSLTPYLALSYMFGQQKQLFDVELLALFIRCLGVYPPGTVVELSNGAIGMVMSVNPKNQLNPSVVLYDPEVPKSEALIVDLADEPDLRVEKSIRLVHLPPEALDYLSPRSKITYFVEA